MSAHATMTMTRVFGFALLGLSSFACNNQGDIAQPGGRPVVAVAAQDAGGAVKRTIEQRSPFGNTVSNPANLLADGDFEFTGRTEQMPWIVFGAAGQETLNYDTGGLCHSGVRCGNIAPGDTLIGYLASPKTGTLDISLWVAPLTSTDGGSASPPACNTVLLSVKDFNDPEAGTDISSDTAMPTDGWCHFEGSAPNYAEKAPVLWVSLTGASQGARIDDGVVKPSAAGNAGRLPLLRKSSPAESARVAFIGEYLRTHRRY